MSLDKSSTFSRLKVSLCLKGRMIPTWPLVATGEAKWNTKCGDTWEEKVLVGNFSRQWGVSPPRSHFKVNVLFPQLLGVLAAKIGRKKKKHQLLRAHSWLIMGGWDKHLDLLLPFSPLSYPASLTPHSSCSQEHSPVNLQHANLRVSESISNL